MFVPAVARPLGNAHFLVAGPISDENYKVRPPFPVPNTLILCSRSASWSAYPQSDLTRGTPSSKRLGVALRPAAFDLLTRRKSAREAHNFAEVL